MTAEVTEQALTVAGGDLVGGGLPEWRFRRVTQYIGQNLQGPLRLEELGAAVQMSPYHFAHLFKRRTGVSPHRFVVQQRIAKARAMLAAPTPPIAVVARSVGFRTPSHFATVFRRITGFTPSGCRRRAMAHSAAGLTDDRVVSEYSAEPLPPYPFWGEAG